MMKVDSALRTRFERVEKESFSQTLNKRVRQYFTDNKISPNANAKMRLKSIGMFALYVLPYLFLLIFAEGPLAVVLSFILMGVGMAGIGMGVMHDAAHGAYSSKKWENKLWGASIYLISGNLTTWKIQHNILHHTFTNIDGLDEDMETQGLLRLHPSQPLKKYHRFQAIYTPFVYGLLTLNWLISKDFKQMLTYYRRGIGGENIKSIGKKWWTLGATKALYAALFIALPLIFAGAAWYWVLLGFLAMHFTAGVILSYVFQLAHMVDGVESHEQPEDGKIKEEFMIHQLKTTANFARKNWLVNWYVGGLNYQVEHHLFPNICHIHYPAISKIVKQTAEEHNLPYNEYRTTRAALKAHIQHLSKMGSVAA